eukprot:Gb_40183 [translate_table: standard]
MVIMLNSADHSCGIRADSEKILKEENESKECSMCGDVGFKDWLFQCQKCKYRFQHRYCSRAYYEFGSENCHLCDWCFPDQKLNSKRAAVGVVNIAESRQSFLPFRDQDQGRTHAVASSKRKSSEIRTMNKVEQLQNDCQNIHRKTPGNKVRRRYRALDEILC